jgi:hypothetical protein
MTDNEKKDANTRTHLQKIAHSVNEQLPEGWGFILMAFPYDEPNGRLNYVASCKREDGIKVVREWLKKQSNPDNFGKHL